jgi:hypothetical protein
MMKIFISQLIAAVKSCYLIREASKAKELSMMSPGFLEGAPQIFSKLLGP